MEGPAPRVYIGIDPGSSGGMAALTYSDGTLCGVQTAKLDGTDKETCDWLVSLGGLQFTEGLGYTKQFAVIEKVGGHVGVNQPGSAMFKFGRSAGFLHGCLVSIGIPYEEVTPQKWQKALGIPGRGKDESKTAWKNRLKQFAERLFPGVKVTLATSDALLIAEYNRRSREGKL